MLQYLPDPDVAPAVANIAAMAKGLVYIEVTTRADLRDNVDKTRTDSDIFIRNGSYYRGTRDYSEAGLSRAFTPAPAVAISVSARIHRTERHYEYSYRVIGTANFRLKLR